ncbi:MAG TPA: PilZ domain-containing protein [Geobacteraceae bacterium]|nr:PilZ domain-containing protein [Geobacteraceae bacterium]
MIKLLSNTEAKVPRPGHYKLLTVRNANEDCEEIVKVLSVIMHNGMLNDLVLLNYYNGMPISFGATVEQVRNGIVVMSVHSFQAMSMHLQNMTFLKSELLPHWVMANVLQVDRENNLAYLGLFMYVHNPEDKRMYLRMRLPQLVEASFRNSKREVPGAVQEISIGGVALLTPREKLLKEKEKGIVSLLLPDDRLELPGEFLLYQEAETLKRHIFQFRMSSRSERIFSQFIYRQQCRIMEELKNLPSPNLEDWRS